MICHIQKKCMSKKLLNAIKRMNILDRLNILHRLNWMNRLDILKRLYKLNKSKQLIYLIILFVIKRPIGMILVLKLGRFSLWVTISVCLCLCVYLRHWMHFIGRWFIGIKIQCFIITRRYGPLRWPYSSSCRGFQPFGCGFFCDVLDDFGQKKNNIKS